MLLIYSLGTVEGYQDWLWLLLFGQLDDFTQKTLIPTFYVVFKVSVNIQVDTINPKLDLWILVLREGFKTGSRLFTGMEQLEERSVQIDVE